MTGIDVDKVTALLEVVAQEVIMPRWQALAPEQVREKSPGDLVTEADTEAEVRIEDGLRSLLPGVLVVGEERVAAEPHWLDKLQHESRFWIVDPIDGTRNFVDGDVRFGTMVAHVWSGQVTDAWIYLPALGRIAVAERGSGAWINGERVEGNAQPLALNAMIGAVHGGRLPPPWKERVRANVKKLRENRPAFCAGFDYVELLRGQVHISMFSRTFPWDHVPGAFLAEEGGGRAARFDGSSYLASAFAPPEQGYGILTAMSDAAWRTACAGLFGES